MSTKQSSTSTNEELTQEPTMVQKARKNKKRLNWLLLICVGAVQLILLDLITFTTWKAWQEGSMEVIYKAIAIDMILLWTGVLVGYYSWAIYFYNINLGLTNEDWAEIREKEERGDPVEVRQKNPHEGQTLGLPDGTIRGTLALSLAVGALALLIASLGIDTKMPLNQLFVDTFDFFKTAFLMMIAFYFGNKSLQYLNYQGGMIKGAATIGQSTTSASSQGAQTNSGPTLDAAADIGEVAGARAQLSANETEGPEDTGDTSKTSPDFEKPDSKG